MKKYNKLLLVIALALYVPFSAIYTVKGKTYLTEYGGGYFTYGRYHSYLGSAGTQEYVYAQFQDIVTVPMTYANIFINEYDLDAIYSGTLTITFAGSLTYWQYYCEGNAYIDSATDTTLTVKLVECQKFYIIAYTTDESNVNGRTSSITGTLSKVNNATDTLVYQKYMPYWNFYSFMWANSYGITYYDGLEIPFVRLKSSENSNAYDAHHRITINPGDTVVLYFMTIGYVANSYIRTYSYSGSTLNVLNTQIAYYPQYKNGNAWITLYLNKITVSSPSTNIDFFNIEFTNSDLWIFPMYIGSINLVPDDVRTIAGEPYSNTYTQLLTQMISLLQGQHNPDDDDFINDMTNTIDDYTASETQIHDFFDTSMNDIDLDDYSIPASLAATTQWLVSQMEDIFYEVPDLRILFVLPLVLGIALFFIGRGSVIFRQGNIDRARQVAYGDAVAAEVAKDNMNSQAMKGAAARFGQNERRMEQHHTNTFGYHERNWQETQKNMNNGG